MLQFCAWGPHSAVSPGIRWYDCWASTACPTEWSWLPAWAPRLERWWPLYSRLPSHTLNLSRICQAQSQGQEELLQGRETRQGQRQRKRYSTSHPMKHRQSPAASIKSTCHKALSLTQVITDYRYIDLITDTYAHGQLLASLAIFWFKGHNILNLFGYDDNDDRYWLLKLFYHIASICKHHSVAVTQVSN